MSFGYHADVIRVGSGLPQLTLRNYAENLVYDISQDKQRQADRSVSPFDVGVDAKLKTSQKT